MKSSYTKRALAFWLAVAMVATSAPVAFAAASTSPTSTRTGTSDVGTPTPQAGLTAENQTLNDLTVGTEYTSASPIVSGGQGAYTMTAKEGTLPKWLTLTTDGKLTGTPTEVEPVHPAVPLCGMAQLHSGQELQGALILLGRDREGDSCLAVLRVCRVAQDTAQHRPSVLCGHICCPPVSWPWRAM